MPLLLVFLDGSGNPTKKMDRTMRQGSLFDIPLVQSERATGLAGLKASMRAAMNRIAGEDEDGRKILVDRINAIAQRECVPLTSGGGKIIKKDQLDKWLQPSDQGHAPTLEAMVCFCLATGDASVFEGLLGILGLTAIPKGDLRFLRFGKADAMLQSAKNEYNKAKAAL